MKAIKITVCQQKPMGIERLRIYLENLLINEKDGRTDFVVFPEHFVPEDPKPIDLKDNKYLKAVSEIVNKHKIYLILGTMKELSEEDGKKYLTSVVFEPNGKILGTARKKILHQKHKINGFSSGNKESVFQTEFGKIGIVICIDSENDKILNETLIKNPKIVFIPIRIALPIFYENQLNMIEASRQTAFEVMSNRFFPLAQKHNTIFVRCDLPYHKHEEKIVYGTSMIISPHKIIKASTMKDITFSLKLQL